MYCAIDIGGTKTLVAIFTAQGKLTESKKFPTPDNYDEFKLKLAETVAEMPTKNVRRTVVAVPGRVNRKHGVAIAFGNLPWENIPIGPDVEDILNTPVSIENDANLAGLSEAQYVDKAFHKVLYVTISTGIGGGYVTDGKLDEQLLDSEIGQMLLEHNGRLKSWEDFGSGSAFYKKFGKKVGETADDDSDAWYWLSRNIAIGLISLMAALTPDIVIIGGGGGAHLAKFQDRLNEQLKLYESPMFPLPPVVGAKHPEEAVVYGCYELAKQHAA